MSSRPTDWSPLGLDTDPTPGDAESLANVIAFVGQVLGSTSTVTSTLKSVLDELTGDQAGENFTGKTAKALADKISSRFLNFITNANSAFETLQGALNTYSAALDLYQGTADALLNKAVASGLKPTDPQIKQWAAQATDAGSDLTAASATAAATVESVASGTEPISAWQEFWDIFQWLLIPLDILGLVFGGVLGIIAWVANLAALGVSIYEFATGQLSIAGLVLSIFGSLFPGTRGLAQDLGGLLSKIGSLTSAGLTSLKVGITDLSSAIASITAADLRGLASVGTLLDIGEFTLKGGLYVLTGLKGLTVTLGGLALSAGKTALDFTASAIKGLVDDLSGLGFLSVFLPLDAKALNTIGFAGAFRLGLQDVLHIPAGGATNLAFANAISLKDLSTGKMPGMAWDEGRIDLGSGLVLPRGADLGGSVLLVDGATMAHLTDLTKGGLVGGIAAIKQWLGFGGVDLDKLASVSGSGLVIVSKADVADLNAGSVLAKLQGGSVPDLRTPAELSGVFDGNSAVLHFTDGSVVVKIPETRIDVSGPAGLDAGGFSLDRLQGLSANSTALSHLGALHLGPTPAGLSSKALGGLVDLHGLSAVGPGRLDLSALKTDLSHLVQDHPGSDASVSAVTDHLAGSTTVTDGGEITVPHLGNLLHDLGGLPDTLKVVDFSGTSVADRIAAPGVGADLGAGSRAHLPLGGVSGDGLHLPATASFDQLIALRGGDWALQKTDLLNDLTARVGGAGKLETVQGFAVAHVHAVTNDLHLDLSPAAVDKVLDGLKGDLGKLFEEHFGADGRYGFAPDRVAGFGAGFEDLLHGVPIRLGAQEVKESALAAAHSDFDAAFDMHPSVTGRSDLFGPDWSGHLDELREDVWSGLSDHLSAEFDKLAGLPEHSGDLDALSAAVQGHFQDLVSVEVPARITRGEIIDHALSVLDGEGVGLFGRSMAGFHGVQNEGTGAQLRAAFEAKLGKDFDQVHGPGAETTREGWQPESTTAQEEWNFRLGQMPDFVARASFGSYVSLRFDAAAAGRFDARAELGLSPADVSDAGLAKVKSDFSAAAAKLLNDHLGDPGGMLATGEGAGIFANRVEHLVDVEFQAALDLEAKFEQSVSFVRDDFDAALDDWTFGDGAAGEGHLYGDQAGGVERVWSDFSADLEIGFDNIFRNAPEGHWAAAGGADAVWDRFTAWLLDSAPTRFAVESGAMDAMRWGAGRLDALGYASRLSPEKFGEVGEHFRGAVGTSYHTTWNDFSHHIEGWLGSEKTDGDAFNTRLGELSAPRVTQGTTDDADPVAAEPKVGPSNSLGLDDEGVARLISLWGGGREGAPDLAGSSGLAADDGGVPGVHVVTSSPDEAGVQTLATQRIPLPADPRPAPAAVHEDPAPAPHQATDQQLAPPHPADGIGVHDGTAQVPQVPVTAAPAGLGADVLAGLGGGVHAAAADAGIGAQLQQPAFKAATVKLYTQKLAVAPVVEGLRPDAAGTYDGVLRNVFGADGLESVPADLLPDAGQFARDVDAAFEQTWKGYRGGGSATLSWYQSRWDASFDTLKNGLSDAAHFVRMSHVQLTGAETAAAETVAASGVGAEVGDAAFDSYTDGLRQAFAGLRDGLLNQPFRNAFAARTRFSEIALLPKGVGGRLGTVAAQFAWRDAAQQAFDTAVQEWSSAHDGMPPSSAAALAAHARFGQGAQAMFSTGAEPSAATFAGLVPRLQRDLDLGAAFQTGTGELRTKFEEEISGLSANVLASHADAAWQQLHGAAQELLTGALAKGPGSAGTAGDSAQSLHTQISGLGSSARPRVMFLTGVQALADDAGRARDAALAATAAEIGDVPADVIERVAGLARNGASDAVNAQVAKLSTTGYTLPNVRQALLGLAGALDGLAAGLPAALTHDLGLSETLGEAGGVYADLVEKAGLPEDLAASIGREFRADWAGGWEAEFGGDGFDLSAMLGHEGDTVDRFSLAFSSRWSGGPAETAGLDVASTTDAADAAGGIGEIGDIGDAEAQPRAQAQPKAQAQAPVQIRPQPMPDGGISVGEVLPAGELSTVQHQLGSGDPQLAAHAMNGLVEQLADQLAEAIRAGVSPDALAAALSVTLHVAEAFPLAGMALAHSVAGNLRLRVELVFDDTPMPLQVCAPMEVF